MRSFLPAVLAAPALLAAGLLAGCAARPGPDAPGPPAEIIAVRGVGRVSARPDTALAQVGVEARAPSLADATTEVARRMTAVLERVRTLGVADRDVATVSYVIDPLMAPRRGEEEARIQGYRALNVVQLRVRDLGAVGRVLDAAVAAGANVIRGVSFTVQDRSRLESEARARAVADAHERARQLAAAAGARLGDLLALTEGAPPVPLAERLERAALTAAPGPVEPGELEVVVSVEARYRLVR